MNIKGGYILFARAIDESDVAKFPPHTREIWLYLLRKAEYKDTVISGTNIKRGQLYTTYKDIVEDLSWQIGFRKESYTTEQCSSAMKTLRSASMITTARTTRGVVITVCKYDFYQDSSRYESLDETHSPTNLSESLDDNPNETHSDNLSESLINTSIETGITLSDNLSDNRDDNLNENLPIPKEVKELNNNNSLQSNDCPNSDEEVLIEKPKRRKSTRAKKSEEEIDKDTDLNKKAREAFEARYYRLFKEKYQWQGKDAGNMTRVLNALKDQRKHKGFSNENNVEVVAALTSFLNEAVKDEWILKNFSIATLYSQFNNIISSAKKREQERKYEKNYGAK